jgi:ribose transport system ATP-binding protein
MGMENSRLGWLDRDNLYERTAQVLKSFEHPEIRPETIVGRLSLAARQIVEICRAMAARARIILMDEPTSSLQRPDVERLFGLIRNLRREGISIVYISHFLEEVREIADRFTVLRDGRSVSTGDIDSVSDDELIARMVGRSVESLFPVRTRPVKEEEPVLEVSGLSAPGVKNASFELRRGEILGIAGLMGSGRSQLVRTIFGLQKATAGTIKLRGKALYAAEATPSARLFHRLGYLSEDRKGEGLALSLSVADNVTVTRFRSCSRWGWLNRLAQGKQAAALIKLLRVKTNSVRQPVRTLSGGNQQKIALARLLHQDAEVLLLDEPTRGIDIGSKVQMYETIARCAEENRAVLIVSSYLPELFGMCDRLAVMSRGRFLDARPIEEWTPETVMEAAIGSERVSAATT